ncbi:mechanosensitive ion channel family protein [Formosa algae]|uniref:Small conductance mechanosensitive channel n=1 Tax=Formosa algae TaxID=225843 RepID=A0A9X0YK17_9FLAO|nr:mechanosensitive ion channel domain-containing protein [Formosa algae]MBP1838343.1 small conductance mechanosensitive channel [Formosa algae]MDQ0334478.1 small conductance mechanosensitive channel [Formosa algae]OEI82173.1 mechanosensitive ion channel protein [Formosa algae]PNW26512.1 mechanosensitive ion channel protein [Formosa algae]
MNLENIDTEKWLDLGLEYGVKIIGAILIWIIGSWIIKKLVSTSKKLMTKSGYEDSLQGFLSSLISWGLKILLIITLLGTLGVPTTSFAAIIGAAGLAIGLALQGSLANFAGGVLILLFKPFKVGDYITGSGESGTVKEIRIFTTELATPQNRKVIVPNGPLSNSNIINYSANDLIRLDMIVGVSYDDDIKKTKEVLMNVLTSNPKVLKDPAPMVAVTELADSSVNFAVRGWVKNADYWDVHFENTEAVKLQLDAAGIEIPYPHQVEIHKES